MLTSARRGIVYPNPNRADTADVPRDFLSLVTALEVDLIYGQGTLAARPTSTGGSPGIQGRMYQASDQSPKSFWWDNGTGWDQIGSSTTLFGTRSARPAAAASNAGLQYYATDQRAMYLSDGATWYRQGAQAGDLAWTLEAAARTGYALPGSVISRTGIGADLFALWGTTYGVGDGSTTFGLPDIDGRTMVSKGTHADVSAVGNNDGTTAASRRPKHKHTVVQPAVSAPAVNITDPGHSHRSPITVTGAGSGSSDSLIGSSGLDIATEAKFTGITAGLASAPVASGGTVGPQTGSEPVDTVPYFVGQVQIKL